MNKLESMKITPLTSGFLVEVKSSMELDQYAYTNWNEIISLMVDMLPDDDSATLPEDSKSDESIDIQDLGATPITPYGTPGKISSQDSFE
jgi:hypothetical protein